MSSAMVAVGRYCCFLFLTLLMLLVLLVFGVVGVAFNVVGDIVVSCFSCIFLLLILAIVAVKAKVKHISKRNPCLAQLSYKDAEWKLFNQYCFLFGGFSSNNNT